MSFVRGQSGNPAGRRKGSSNSKNLLLFRSVLEEYGDQLVAKAINMALDGDPVMIKLCIDKMMPSYRAQDAPVVLSGFPHHEQPERQARFLVDAIVSGRISPSQGEAMINAIIISSRRIEKSGCNQISSGPSFDWKFACEQSEENQSSEN